MPSSQPIAINLPFDESLTHRTELNYIQEEHNLLAQLVEDVKETYLSFLNEWTKLTSRERSRSGLKSAYQPGPTLIYAGFTSSAPACAQSSAGDTRGNRGGTAFSDLARATSWLSCFSSRCSRSRVRTSAYSEKTLSTRCG